MANMIDRAMDYLERIHAKRRLAFGIKHSGGPKGVYQSEYLRQLPTGAPVLVLRKTRKNWEVPLTFISVEGETVVIQTKRGTRIFPSTCVKPYVSSQLDQNTEVEDSCGTTDPIDGAYVIRSEEGVDDSYKEELEVNVASKKGKSKSAKTTNSDKGLGERGSMSCWDC